jgi:myo-inositol-1(or 4)-monophosphatase
LISPRRPTRAFVRSLALGAGRVLMRRYSRLRARDVGFKGRRDMVTRADLEAEAYLVSAIRRRFPDHSIVTEEVGRRETGSACRWYLDPLDGTTNFVHSFPFFAVSIGFEVDGVMRLGAVHAPYLRELFEAERGRGAYLNGRRIRVSENRRLIRSLLATGFPYLRHRIPDNNVDHFNAFILKIQGIRRCGVASLDLSYVACGRLDGYWELHLRPWDVAAGGLLVEEAGGRVSDFHGGRDFLEGGNVLATNGTLHPTMRRILNRPGAVSRPRR